MQSSLSHALTADAPKTRSGQGKTRAALTIVAFVLPALLLYILFVLYPIVQAAFYSLYDWNGLGPLSKFVGLDNYRRLFADGVFHMAISHNLTIALLSLCIQLPFALGCGVADSRQHAGPGAVSHHLLSAVRAFRSRHRHRLGLHLPAGERLDQHAPGRRAGVRAAWVPW